MIEQDDVAAARAIIEFPSEGTNITEEEVVNHYKTQLNDALIDS